MQRSLSFDSQWQQTVKDINQLVHIHVNEQHEVDRYKGLSPSLLFFFLVVKCSETGTGMYLRTVCVRPRPYHCHLKAKAGSLRGQDQDQGQTFLR